MRFLPDQQMPLFPDQDKSAEAAWSDRPLLTEDQRALLRRVLSDRINVVCFGAGVDSTAMLVALHAADIPVALTTFADTGAEKPSTLEHVARMNGVLKQWGWAPIETCRKVPKATTPYVDLYGNCWSNFTLPSLAFGMKSCSVKWKQKPQDALIRGVRSGPQTRPPHPIWIEAQERGVRILKLIGYDCGPADIRRTKAINKGAKDAFDYAYPLQLIGWTRRECTWAIVRDLGPELLPQKSSCFMCPAAKLWELFWLAAECPELFEAALKLEHRALTGRHSRFDEEEFGASWEELVRNADRFPSSNTTVGLGRNFAWNQWARVNGVVDETGRVRRDQREVFLARADALQSESGNAFDRRWSERANLITTSSPGAIAA